MGRDHRTAIETDPDPIAIRLNRVVEDISSICRPIILDERTELFFNATRNYRQDLPARHL
jgi:hypothetical protein